MTLQCCQQHLGRGLQRSDLEVLMPVDGEVPITLSQYKSSR